MALVPPVLPSEVVLVGALRPELFNLPDQPSMEAFIQGALDVADAWMVGHLGPLNYGLTAPYAVALQRRGQIYLALEAITDTLKASKIYGTHSAYMSEDSASYAELIDHEWGQGAREMLDLWVTVEKQGTGFALPYFGITTPVDLVEDGTNGLDPLIVLYEEILARARGFSNLDTGTVIR